MSAAALPVSKQKAFRDKARLNAWIAQDLAEGFGGKKADYLKRLNDRLKAEIHQCRKTAPFCFAEAA